MVRILPLSDLHDEIKPFALLDRVNAVETDLIVLAGDIGRGVGAIELAARMQPGVPKVFVPGNHEYYRGDIVRTLIEMRTAANAYPDVLLLDCDALTLTFDGVALRVLGATLWSDFAVRGPDMAPGDMLFARAMMNDYRVIANGDRPLLPQDTLALHEAARAWLDQELARSHDGPTLVVTHHGPSPRSQHPLHGLNQVSGAFLSDLEAMILEHRPELWIHGHTHANVDYRIGRTRVASNQLGYPGEAFCVKDFALSTIEV